MGLALPGEVNTCTPGYVFADFFLSRQIKTNESYLSAMAQRQPAPLDKPI